MGPVEAITTLAAAFQRDLAPETVSVYSAALADIEPDLLAESVRQSIATCKFFPAIAELRRTAARIAGILPPSSGEVLALIRRADVREAVYRRDGTFAYTERYWRWPEDAAPETVALCESVVSKAGEPCDEEGNDAFGWETAARKVYESDLPAIEASALADLSGARLLTSGQRALAAVRTDCEGETL